MTPNSKTLQRIVLLWMVAGTTSACNEADSYPSAPPIDAAAPARVDVPDMDADNITPATTAAGASGSAAREDAGVGGSEGALESEATQELPPTASGGFSPCPGPSDRPIATYLKQAGVDGDRIQIVDDQIYVGDFSRGVTVLDISNPTDLKVLAVIPGGKDFYANDKFLAIALPNAVEVYEVPSGGRLKRLSVYDWEGEEAGGLTLDMVGSGSFVYLWRSRADYSDVLATVNLTDPASPVAQVSDLDTNGGALHLLTPTLLAIGLERLALYDLSNNWPEYVASTPELSEYTNDEFALDGNILYANDGPGIIAFDVTDWEQPKHLGGAPGPTLVQKIQPSGDELLVSTPDRFIVYDATDPSALVEKARYPLTELGRDFAPSPDGLWFVSATYPGVFLVRSGVCEPLPPDSPEGCLGETNVTSQAEIDALAGVTCIVDGLRVSGLDVTNLRALSALRIVGDLTITNTSLTDLSGLEGVEFMESVYTIAAQLVINNNPLLKDLQGLEGLRHVPGGVFIYENESLESLDGLNNLESVVQGTPESNSIVPEISVQDNPVLSNIDALSSLLIYRGEYMTFAGNPQLPACTYTELAERIGTTCEDCIGNLEPECAQ